MLAFFRRIINSKAGLIITLVVLGTIALAFASGDVSSLRTQGLAALGGSDDVVTVGDARITAPDLRQRILQQVEQGRQQQPTLDVAQFIAGGGFEATVERLTDALAIQQLARQAGARVSKRSIDGQIAAIPGLQGADGKFDPDLFRALLAQRKLSERGVRDDIELDMTTQLLSAGLLRPAGQAPAQLAQPYADLSLDKRGGQIAFVPSAAMPAGAPASDAEARAWYQSHLARYTVPERRVIRYARIGADQVKARATPTDAEIAKSYNDDRAKYAATQKRSLTTVVVLDQAGATRLAAAAKGGSLTTAAKAAGLTASTQTLVDQATLATSTSPAFAAAAFAASKGALVGPVRGGLGYTVATVDAVQQVAGRGLAQVHDEIAATLLKGKTTEALARLHDTLDDAIGGNSTFDELVADQHLAAATTPALLANGIDPDQPAAKPDPALAPLVQAAFAGSEGDEPQLVPTDAAGGFALVALSRVTRPTPVPFAQARPRVAADIAADRARLAARRIAGDLLARLDRGTPMAAAWTATGLKAAPPHPLNAARDDVDRAQGANKAVLALLFAMGKGQAKLLEAPGGAGWAVIKLDTITPGRAAGDATRNEAVRSAFTQVLGHEYLQQFARAARLAVNARVNADAVARVKADLLKSGAAQ